MTILGRGASFGARQRAQHSETRTAAQMQVEYQYVRLGGGDLIDRIVLGLHGIDQVHVGKTPDQFR